VKMGDVHRDPNTQSADAPPTLRAPGEKLPTDADSNNQRVDANREGAMKPVVFPKDTTKDAARTVDAHPDKTKAAADAEKASTDKADANKADAAKKDGASDSVKPAASGAPAKPDAKPDGAPARPPYPQATPPSSTPPNSNFYPSTAVASRL
jgi:hypothetical protein